MRDIQPSPPPVDGRTAWMDDPLDIPLEEDIPLPAGIGGEPVPAPEPAGRDGAAQPGSHHAARDTAYADAMPDIQPPPVEERTVRMEDPAA